MRHYFVSQEYSKEKVFSFNARFLGENFCFASCPDVFSKNELDYGSLVLAKSIVQHQQIFSGKIMDMCCGYGTIAILLSRFVVGEYYLSDVNSTAVELAKINAQNNSPLINCDNIYVGDMFDNIDMVFNHIVSNPPIKVGKKYLINFVEGSYSHLDNGGTLTLVIKKNLGADSCKKLMQNVFGNAEVWERDKGYYVLHSTKN